MPAPMPPLGALAFAISNTLESSFDTISNDFGSRSSTRSPGFTPFLTSIISSLARPSSTWRCAKPAPSAMYTNATGPWRKIACTGMLIASSTRPSSTSALQRIAGLRPSVGSVSSALLTVYSRRFGSRQPPAAASRLTVVTEPPIGWFGIASL